MNSQQTHALAATANTAALPSKDDSFASYTELSERMKAEFDAFDSSTLIPINVDIPTSVTTALGVLPAVETLMPQLVSAGMLEKNHLVRLSDCARFLNYAHAGFVSKSAEFDELPEVYQQAAKLRESLVSDCIALVKRSLLDRRLIEELRGTKGYQDTAIDLLAMTRALRENWTMVGSRTAIVASELDDAEKLADALLTGLGLRDKRKEVLTQQASERQIAFTLFYRCYEEVRRAVSYLRWHEGDADKLAPSLYAKAGGVRRKETAQEPAIAAPENDTKPTQTPGTSQENTDLPGVQDYPLANE